MTRAGCTLVLIAFAAPNVGAESPAARSPVEVTAKVHVRSIDGSIFADDATLDGRGPGASVRVGLNWLHLQLAWNYVQEDVAESFGDRRFDESAHQFLLGPSFVAHWGSRVSASVGSGFALAYYNGPGAPELKTGAWGDLRIDVDVLRIAEGHAITVVLDASVVLAHPGGIGGSIGIGYHRR